MLEELHVRDLASVRDAWLEFGPGLNVLTGETGAGKTVLLGALQLLLGGRSDSQMVRAGAAEAVVSGRFVEQDGELVVRRRVSAEGRSRCYIDDEPATVNGLSARSGPLVDLHGQHEHQALMAPATHVGYLDRFAGAHATAALATYRRALADLREAHEAHADLVASMTDRERRVDYLRFQAAEIDASAPLPGEDEDLEARLPRLRHAERLADAAQVAFRSIRDDDGACDRLAESLAALSSVAGIDPAFDDVVTGLTEASVALDELGSRLRELGESVDHDPRQLDETEARLAALSALKRKYGPGLADVIRTREEAAVALETLESGERGLAEAEERLARAEDALRASARTLTEVRDAAVPAFIDGLAETAAELALSGVVFDVARTPLPVEQWTADGPQRIEFLFAASKGETPRPLARVASGGEVSRVMLALKGVLGRADDVPILVFDEIDAGIGGATGLAIGRRLRRLARDHQVLVVTHLAQVAAFADTHLVVEKAQEDGRAVTRVRGTHGEERVTEIARMLSGDASAAGTEHARELLRSVAADEMDGPLKETG